MTDLEKVLNSIPDHQIIEAMQNSLGVIGKIEYSDVMALSLDGLVTCYCSLFKLSADTKADILRRLT